MFQFASPLATHRTDAKRMQRGLAALKTDAKRMQKNGENDETIYRPIPHLSQTSSEKICRKRRSGICDPSTAFRDKDIYVYLRTEQAEGVSAAR